MSDLQKYIAETYPQLSAPERYLVYREALYGAVKYADDTVKRIENKK